MISAEILARALGGRPSGDGWIAHCPAHEDSTPSLSVAERDGTVLVKCFAGCSQEQVLQALRDRDLWPKVKSNGSTSFGHGCSGVQGLSLAALAVAKRLPAEVLTACGAHDSKWGSLPAVAIPYVDEDGREVARRYRINLTGDRFRWRKGDKAHLYGLSRLAEAREAGWVLLVEGESDCWTAWHHGLPALGLPGKSTWRREWARLLKGLEVVVWQEPEAEDLVRRLLPDLPGLRAIREAGYKDLSEAHLAGVNVVQLVERLREMEPLASALETTAADADLARLREVAAPVLEAGDPLEAVKEAFRLQGYGGDLKAPTIVYLAATTRLLAMRKGTMPAHLLLIGPTSAGKSFTTRAVLSLLPPEAYHEIDAASPRALIYDETDMRHRLLVFAEADSLPAGEDNPAASAVRNMLQEHRLRYDVVERDEESGRFSVRHIERPGPTVLFTTAVRALGEQLMSRFFVLPVADDRKQLAEVLDAQAKVEEDGLEEPPPALAAYQALLQRGAPWQVVVPYVRALAESIKKTVHAPRILRDFQRLLSLVKAVAILRHRTRERDAYGRLVATVDDWGTVHDLVSEMYAASATGVTENIRRCVMAVTEGARTYSDVARLLEVAPIQARRNAQAAIRNGWLVNEEPRKGYPALLSVGEPLPDTEGLPTPERILNTFTPVTAGYATMRSAGSAIRTEGDRGTAREVAL